MIITTIITNLRGWDGGGCLHGELTFSLKDKNMGVGTYIEVGTCSGNYGKYYQALLNSLHLSVEAFVLVLVIK